MFLWKEKKIIKCDMNLRFTHTIRSTTMEMFMDTEKDLCGFGCFKGRQDKNRCSFN